MAHWDVGGYMKLQFGKNAKDAFYYIDNFTISREVFAGLKIDSEAILIDNFNQKKETNALGRGVTTFMNSIGGSLKKAFNSDDAGGKGHSLELSYDVSQTDSYAGYISPLQGLDLRGYYALTFFVKGKKDNNLFVGLKDRSGHESKVMLSHYLPENITTTWQKVTIPLVAFTDVKDWGTLENLSLSFKNNLNDKGTLLVDNIEFKKGIKAFMVDNFENSSERNFLRGRQTTFASGAAAINGQYTKGSPNGIYRLSYGGNIGTINAYASELKSYAGWTTVLGGIYCSECGSLSFRFRGAEGGENFNIYLDDGNFRWGVDIEKYTKVTTSWQKVSIPINEFSDYGVDITHLAELKVVFEGVKMSGTIYLDNIRFGATAH
ncbi:MAG: carbohydrate binding domain-containing protein [Thermodesulfobacteriota bacterium]|nr:carbohydrate binding domain-containing protein [Thermodesulfobacteriota bacterium]